MAVTHETTDGTDTELTCPVRGCDYTNPSPQGIAAHVGNGHKNGWADAEGTPQDVHAAATVRDSEAFDRATRVREHLARNGVTSDDVGVFYHFGYGNVQIQVGRVDLDEWDAFENAADVDGIHYAGRGLWYCSGEFVERLPQSVIADVDDAVACGAAGCGRMDNLQRVTRFDRGGRVLCPSCRKQYLGVTS